MLAFLLCLAVTLSALLPMSWLSFILIERRFYRLGWPGYKPQQLALVAVH